MSLTQNERDTLIKMMGVSPVAVPVVEEPVIEEMVEAADIIDPVAPATMDTPMDAIVASIVAKANGVKESALALADAHAQRIFDEGKLSKVQAAQRGLVASDHNRTLWAHVQKVRNDLKTALRKHYNHTAQKIALTSKVAHKKSADLSDVTLDRLVNDPAFQALLAKHQSQ